MVSKARKYYHKFISGGNTRDARVPLSEKEPDGTRSKKSSNLSSPPPVPSTSTSQPLTSSCTPNNSPTLLLHLTPTSVRPLLHSPSSGLLPIQFENNSPSILFQLLLIKSQSKPVFIYGNAVPQYLAHASRHPNLSKNLINWHLSKLLSGPHYKHHYFPNSHSSIVKVNTLSLLSLYFRDLKRFSEFSSNIPAPFKTVIFAISPWLSNIERRRLILAAAVADFQESFVVSQPTLLTLLHLSRPVIPCSNTPQNILVLREVSGVLCLLRYTATKRETGITIKLIKITEEIDLPANSEPTTAALEILFREMQEALPPGTLPLPETDSLLLLFCDDAAWKEILIRVIPNRPVVMYHKHLEAFTGMRITPFETLQNAKILDWTMDLFRTDNTPENGGIVKINNLQVRANEKFLTTNLGRLTRETRIFQSFDPTTGENLPVGRLLFIPASDWTWLQNLEAVFRVDKQGIVYLHALSYNFNETVPRNSNQDKIQYFWTSCVTSRPIVIAQLQSRVLKLDGGSLQYEYKLRVNLVRVKELAGMLLELANSGRVLVPNQIMREELVDLKNWAVHLINRVRGSLATLIEFNLKETERWIKKLQLAWIIVNDRMEGDYQRDQVECLSLKGTAVSFFKIKPHD